jgi:hypothetical protein
MFGWASAVGEHGLSPSVTSIAPRLRQRLDTPELLFAKRKICRGPSNANVNEIGTVMTSVSPVAIAVRPLPTMPHCELIPAQEAADGFSAVKFVAVSLRSRKVFEARVYSIVHVDGWAGPSPMLR